MTIRECAERLLVFAGGLIPGGPPKVQRIVHGRSVLEVADQLTVNVTRLSPSNSVGGSSNAALLKAGSGAENRVDFVVTWARCYPTFDSPKVDWVKIEAASLVLLDDVWPLWIGFNRGVYDGTLKGLLGASRVTVSDIVPVEVQAGLAGWSLTVQAFL